MIKVANEITSIEVGTTLYVPGIKIRAYIDSLQVTNLENAGKRGKTCTCVSISSPYADYENTIVDIVNRLLKAESISLGSFINELANGDTSRVKEYWDFHIAKRAIKGVHMFSPFCKVSEKAEQFFSRFAEDFQKAQKIIDQFAASTDDDGGTANMDGVFIAIDLPEKEVKTLAIRNNIELYEKNHAWLGKGYLIGFQYFGQGRKREISASKAYNHLKDCGYDVMQWHQMD